MRTRVVGAAVPVVLGTLATLAALWFTNLDRALVLDVFLVFVGVVALQALARATGAATRAGTSAFEDALRPRPVHLGAPERLLRLRSLLSLGTATAGDFHHGLRPPLRAAAAHALALGHGIDLDADERAAGVLGREAWELLAGERPAPDDRFAPGPTLAAVSRTVDAIEGIAP